MVPHAILIVMVIATRNITSTFAKCNYVRPRKITLIADTLYK